MGLFRIFRQKGFWILLLTALVLLAVVKLSADDSPGMNSAERWVRNSYAPLQRGTDWIQQGLGQLGTRILGIQDISQILATEQAKSQQLGLEVMQLRESQAEVERLRRLLDYKNAQPNSYELEAARIIARASNNWYKTLTIDKGADFGLVLNMPVITPDGLVGKLVNVSKGTAQVMLLTDREMAVGAILQQTRENRGIVEGVGNGQLRMINIPYYSQVQGGEPVVTSGLSQIYPPGILIGTVRDVQKEANGLVLSAYVAPAVDFDRLEEVLIIKSFPAGPSPADQGV